MIYVLYHASCRDGFAAAYAAWKHFGDKGVKYTAVNHGDPPPKMVDGSHVYILDFSYDRVTIQKLKKRMSSLLIIDHHKTAQEDLAGLDYAEFDMNKSGATMTWAKFHPDTPPPPWFNHIEDRDLWKFELKDTEKITEALLTFPHTFEVWDNLKYGDLLRIGEGVVRYKNSYVTSVTRKPLWHTIDGHRVPVVNTGSFISNVANKLCEMYPQTTFAACYFDVPGRRVWSLRSIGDFDVGVVAKNLGGGGHRNASGFSEENIS